MKWTRYTKYSDPPVTDLMELDREHKKLRSVVWKTRLSNFFLYLVVIAGAAGVIGILSYGKDWFDWGIGFILPELPKGEKVKPFSMAFAKMEEFEVTVFTDYRCRGKQYRIRLSHKPTGVNVESEPITKHKNNETIERLFQQIEPDLEEAGYKITFTPLWDKG